jgi:hypothetical protein
MEVGKGMEAVEGIKVGGEWMEIGHRTKMETRCGSQKINQERELRC